MGVKVCINCNRVNPGEEEFCVGCGESEFTELLFPLEEE